MQAISGCGGEQVTIRTMDRLRSLRPPRTRHRVDAPGARAAEAVVVLASGLTPQLAVERLLRLIDLPDSQEIMLLPSVASRPGRGTHPQVAAALLGQLGRRASLGLPTGTSMPVRRRWENLARRLGARPTTLGQAGWDRIDFPPDYLLDAAYLPAEVLDAGRRIAIPALGDESLALGFWGEIVHPHTRLRSAGKHRNRLMAELSTTVPASYLLDASRLPGGVATNLMAWTDDPVAAELVGLGIRRYVEDAQGYETSGPWENERIQAAAELGPGPASGSDLLLRVDDSTSGSRATADYLADQLSSRIEWVTERDDFER